MSPPIRDGSGNSIGSVRLGDGTEIAEIRTGAGDVLFSASAIPDSGDLYAAFLPSYLSLNYTDTDNISQWDSDDSSISLTEADSGDQPTYVATQISNDGSAEFSGQSGGSSEGTNLKATGLSNLTESNGITVALLIKEKSASDFQGLLAPEFDADGDPNNVWNVRYNNGSYEFLVDGDESLTVSSPSDTSKHTLIGTIESGTGRWYLDGGTPSSTTDLSAATFTSTSLSLGQYQLSDPAFFNFDGYIAAALVYVNGRSESKVNDIHDYLINL